MGQLRRGTSVCLTKHHKANRNAAEPDNGRHEFRRLLSGEDSEHSLPCANQEHLHKRADEASNHSPWSRQTRRGSTAASLIMSRQPAAHRRKLLASKKFSLFSQS
jgi:hypothetical protein